MFVIQHPTPSAVNLNLIKRIYIRTHFPDPVDEKWRDINIDNLAASDTEFKYLGGWNLQTQQLRLHLGWESSQLGDQKHLERFSGCQKKEIRIRLHFVNPFFLQRRPSFVESCEIQLES